MKNYGQYCPVSRASEVLAERWTPLVVRNLLLGSTTFNEIAGGVPGMSRSLLAQRLTELERSGVVWTTRRAGRRGKLYRLTESGRALSEVIGALSAWGRRFIEIRAEHTDPSFVLWAWVHVHLERQRLPARRVVVRFEFPDERPPHHRFWILFEKERPELCYSPPKFENDLEVRARSEPFTRWHVGALEWRAALKAGEIVVRGPSALARQLPSWNGRALAS